MSANRLVTFFVTAVALTWSVPLLYQLTATGGIMPELLLIAACQVLCAGLVGWLAYRNWNRSPATLRALPLASSAHAQTMEAVGQLSGGVAHDFNNSLTSIMGNLELALTEGSLSSRQRRYAEAAFEAAQRSALLVERLLAFARRQALNPVPTDLSELLERVSGRLGAVLGANVALTVSAAEPLPLCMVDPQQLEQALLNLVLNARDAMPDGGRVDVRAAPAPEVDHAGASPAAGGCRILVSDTGIGIPVAHLQQVFEPFFTTKAPGRGSGLGLSMVYGFAQQSGGSVAIYGGDGGGTRVELWLPAGRVEAPASSA